jgi:hypothetical protein
MRKLDEDLVVYTTIEPMGGEYKLTALRYIDGGHCMPNLEIGNDSIKESWDSVDYLKRMLNTLDNWKNRQLTEEDLAFIKELEEFIPEDDFDDLYIMFYKANELKFFEE